MEFKKQMLREELGLQNTGKKNFTLNKSQKVIVSEEQLNRLLSILSEDAKPDFLDLDKDGNKKESMKKAAKDKKEMDEQITLTKGKKGKGVRVNFNWPKFKLELPRFLKRIRRDIRRLNWGVLPMEFRLLLLRRRFRKMNCTTARCAPFDGLNDEKKIESVEELKNVKETDAEVKELEDTEATPDVEGYVGEGCTKAQEALGMLPIPGGGCGCPPGTKEDETGKCVDDEEELDETYASMDHTHRDEFDGRDSEVIGVDSDIDKQRLGMSETTHPITESEVKEISNFMDRMNTTGRRYNPAPSQIKSNPKRLSELHEDVNKTYRAIRKAIINERTGKLELKDYQEVLSEGFNTGGPNPGLSAAAGIENIIDNIKRAYTYVKDSRTRKQIANTLTKLNNFMTYTAELVGSGRDQRASRSYSDVSNPLPFPELDEPEELEDVDDEISITEDDDRWMQKADDDIEKRGTEGVFHKWCVDHGYRDGCDKGCWTAADAAGGVWVRRAGLAKAFCESKH
jgi:hypothetical protein